MNDVLKVCIDLAIKAGAVIMEVYEEDFKVDIKEDKSPLTEADRRSNEIIVSGLKRAFPDYAVLSEESRDDGTRLENDWCFIVDPLDGTKEFVKRNGQFTVNIALSYKGKSVAGVIYVPVTNELYYAAEGKGAYRVESANKNYLELLDKDSQKLGVTDKINDLIVIGSRSHMSEKLKELMEANKDKIEEVRTAGSSLKGCIIARGEADVYYRFGPTMEWDTAAMQCIIEESGGIFRQMDHSEMTYNRVDSLNSKGFYIVNTPENIWV